MQDFIMEGGRIRPSARFSSAEGVLNLEGRSLLESAEEVFDKMNKWFNEYVNNPRPETTINIALEYFNSSTAKALIRFLIISKKLENKSKLTINFYYDDENVLEYGRDFSDVIDIPFNFIEKNFH
jgi:hypothetical protein